MNVDLVHYHSDLDTSRVLCTNHNRWPTGARCVTPHMGLKQAMRRLVYVQVTALQAMCLTSPTSRVYAGQRLYWTGSRHVC